MGEEFEEDKCPAITVKRADESEPLLLYVPNIIDHISNSQISKWLACPRDWEYRYIKGLIVPKNGNLFFGSTYHTAIEILYNVKKDIGALMEVDDLKDAFSDAWDAGLLEPDGVVFGEEDDPVTLKNKGHALVGLYRDQIAKDLQPEKIEYTINSKVAGVKMITRLDLEDSNHIFIDHKTSGKLHTQADLDKDLQATGTAFALHYYTKDTDYPIERIEYHHHIAIKTTIPKLQILKTYRTMDDVNWWVNMVAKITSQMKTGICPPNPTGWKCSPKYCDYYTDCRGELTRAYSMPY
jgi:hypothetical protein